MFTLVIRRGPRRGIDLPAQPRGRICVTSIGSSPGADARRQELLERARHLGGAASRSSAVGPSNCSCTVSVKSVSQRSKCARRERCVPVRGFVGAERVALVAPHTEELPHPEVGDGLDVSRPVDVPRPRRPGRGDRPWPRRGRSGRRVTRRRARVARSWRSSKRCDQHAGSPPRSSHQARTPTAVAATSDETERHLPQPDDLGGPGGTATPRELDRDDHASTHTEPDHTEKSTIAAASAISAPASCATSLVRVDHSPCRSRCT